MKHTLTFEFEYSTKNSVRYKEITTGIERPVVRTFYIGKHALPFTTKFLTITV